jgi:hypothetical protein
LQHVFPVILSEVEEHLAEATFYNASAKPFIETRGRVLFDRDSKPRADFDKPSKAG